ncbi:MAG: deoxyribonuclease V [Deltaproteobacteria bacterium]|nr:deoxyribonuclease V [Deltaproteobacteria bacterium]MBW1960118.1 deoxyribonuclease V [Deltaproteobacteria bacterium]MBW1994079.1 deoxyribonuclease V [Deltaproteobacteria bacterium]MBW2153496.1 deoxyribonuclease V [Deltaproteobacteria bacterium]
MYDCLNRWDLTAAEAKRVQEALSTKCIEKPLKKEISTVAGVDVAVRNKMTTAAAVILRYPTLDELETATVTLPVEFPYIPGLLSFREGPVILEAIGKLKIRPDLIIFDGQGRAHPRRLGIACHMGILLDIPSIGCAKSRLCGKHTEPGIKRGCHVPLIDNEEVIGAVVRTRTGVKPVYVSVGHRIDLNTSIHFVLECCRGYRLPETTRRAHRLATTAAPQQ